LGNLRTAMFAWLLARSHHGRFLLRIEDTDASRSSPELAAALMRDLRWLGLDWDEGPEAGGAAGPYWQSQRTEIYARHYATLLSQGMAYPCFCSEARLAVLRKSQAAAGQPPRYDGACARLASREAQARRAAGEAHTLRFRLPVSEDIGFEDLVRGPQRFACADLGDFIIRRSDGSAAFLFCNALDDALMGVTDVLRGEDHLSNTPRQLAVLQALELPAPRYGHLSTITGVGGAKLSKREGAAGVDELRQEGWLPLAVLNTLARLGHHHPEDDGGLLDLARLAARFDVRRLSRAPAHFDPAQLGHYQKLVLAALPDAEFAAWLDAAPVDGGGSWRALLPAGREMDFVHGVRANIGTPSEARDWARCLFQPQTAPASAEAAAGLLAAGAGFLRVASNAFGGTPEFSAALALCKAATGAKGKSLFLPLRAAWTGQTHGPELERIHHLLGAVECARRLSQAATQLDSQHT
jgi:glutamyl-tRNA synthetase